MRRCLLLLVLIPSSIALGQETSSSREVQLIDRAMQETAHKAEGAIASILVSRSEDYRRLLKESPPAEEPGELGGFDRVQARKTLSETIKDSKKLEATLRRLDLSDPENVPESYGTGVAISDRGLILTNFHVVEGASKIYVRLPGGKGSFANIHAGDARCDLAVLRLIDSSILPVPFLRPTSGQVRKGQLILTMTNAFAPGFRDASPRAAWGIISNLHQKLPKSSSPWEQDKWTLHQLGTLIQIDRSLPIGSSGGAILNLDGQMVGIITSTAGISGELGGALAMPLDATMGRIIGVLEKGEEVEYGFLGIQFDPPGFERQNRFQPSGVHFRDLVANSPAMKAGLERGDTILAVDDFPVSQNDDLRFAIGRALAGTTIKLKVRRALGQTETVPVRLVKSPLTESFIASVKHPFARGVRVDYTSTVTPRGPPSTEIPRGVLVREVQKGSQAESARLQDATIIKVDGQEVRTPTDFYEKMNKKGPVKLTVSGISEDSNQWQEVTLD
jgi:serine protease Do